MNKQPSRQDLMSEHSAQSHENVTLTNDPKVVLRMARKKALRDPTYKIVVRDMEFLNNDSAMYDPNFNAERFFFFTNEARAQKRARDRKKINMGGSPLPS